MAWLLGSNLSLAALANDRAASAEKVAEWFTKAQRLSKLMGITLADLPPRPTADAADPRATRAIEYLYAEGQGIGRQLGARQDDELAALFELAVKSNVLLVLYQPNAPVLKSLTAAIDQAAERASLPAELWQPLLQAIDDDAPFATVRDTVFQLHDDVDRYLTRPQP